MDVTKGRIRQSVVSWCYEPMPLETLARHAAAIVATGYTGFVGQEFIPTRDPIQSLREAVRLCDV
jgi:hypothetical protein